VSVRERPRARGRHFLRSSSVAADLVRTAAIRPGDVVLDLGAGAGALTAALARAGADVVAVELDALLAARLRGRFARVVEADARVVALPSEPFKVVANLPFAAGTALLRRLLRPETALVSADVIVEWGLAVKRTSLWPSTRLAVEWAAWFELALVRRLPGSCFAPPPSVDAAVMRAVRRPDPLVPDSLAVAYRRFLDRGFRDGPRAVVPPRTLRRLGVELGFDHRAAPRDLDARQWASLYCRTHVLAGPARRPARALESRPTRTPLTRSSEAGKESNVAGCPAPDHPACALSARVAAPEKVLLDGDGLARTLSRIAHEIIEANPDLRRVALVGIQTRGVPLAQRLRRLVEERSGAAPPVGTVDITFYRDDVQVRGGDPPRHPQPVVRSTALEFPLEGKTVVLVDDVLYTGRTIRAAIEALFDYGRPERIQLAVIVDRGHRELPIRPDYVGKNLPTSRDERIQVQLVEVDEVDRILLVPSPEEGSYVG
jgi:pyrimidine operon attenuation protein/uracil phosphoribosyltransferase